MSTSVQAQQLHFLQEKIEQIGSAIFFNLSDSVLKLPTSIVTTLKVDDFGYVWFFVKKPNQHIQEFEKEFPVRMDFFKKGMDYFLQVSGKGWVVIDPEQVAHFIEANNEVHTGIFNDMVLVKVKMLKAEYYETQNAGKATWWKQAINTVTTWFRHPNSIGRHYFPAS
jgi:general stress protein 26